MRSQLSIDSATSERPEAVVVGACAHGLALVRTLAQRGVAVHLLESNPKLPGTATRYAAVHPVDDINGPGLITALLSWRANHRGRPGGTVLFLTNDNMVRQVARGWNALSATFRLSWSSSRDTVERFLSKSAIQAQCEANGLLYPRSIVLGSLAELESLHRTDFPLIVKPVRPLSGFKVELVQSLGDLRAMVIRHHADLPFLLQQWIPGDDRALRFCALYLADGNVVARFDGQKLRSRRPALGGTTAAVPLHDSAVYEHTLQFFRGLDLSGPVSLELKKDQDSKFWVIEPTVGRTDYWVGCCIANGVDFPYVEYCHQAGLRPPPTKQEAVAIWCDTEYDRLARVSLFLRRPSVEQRRAKIVYPYLDWVEWGPLLKALRQFTTELSKRLVARVKELPSRLMSRID
jgi:D-aspartate ligase